MGTQPLHRDLHGSLCRTLRGAGLVGLLVATSSAGAAWINMNTIARGQVSLLIDTVPAGGPLTVTFNVADATALTPTVGTPDMQFQLAVRRRLGGPNVTARLDGNSAPNLSGPELIPFTEITWTFIRLPGGGSQPGGTQPISGTNVPIGTNPMKSLTTTAGGAIYAGGELRFSFTPSRVYLQGLYTGTVTFTATQT